MNYEQEIIALRERVAVLEERSKKQSEYSGDVSSGLSWQEVCSDCSGDKDCALDSLLRGKLATHWF